MLAMAQLFARACAAAALGGFEPNDTAMLLGRGKKGTWARSTCIAEHVGMDCCAGTNSGMGLAMVFFCWLLLRCVGAGGGGDGFHVLLKPAVGMGGCFAVSHRPSCYSLPLDTPAVETS